MSTRFPVASFFLLGLILVLLAACTALPPATPNAAATLAPAGDAAAETNGMAAGNMQQLLARQLGLPTADVRIVSVEPMEWSDACLGAAGAGRELRPGRDAGLQAHLRGGRRDLRLPHRPLRLPVPAGHSPRTPLGETIIAWTGQAEDGSCREAFFSTEGLAFGRCGGKLLGTSYVKQTRQAELVDFAARYASFDVPTPTGTIKFAADGPTAATPAEQRMLAEWAWLVQWEAQNGGPITWSEALAWHREGGVAGFCDDLTIDVTGEATARSCAGGQQVKLGRTLLNAAQFADLYRWIDTLQPFQTEDGGSGHGRRADRPAGVQRRRPRPGSGRRHPGDLRLRRAGLRADRGRNAGCDHPDRLSGEHRSAAGRSMDTVHGYCLAYPAEYKVEKPNPDSTLLVIGGLLDASNPRVEIRVEDAGAGGLEAAVSRMEADYSGFPFERSDAAVSGTPAVVLDGLPGQEITRRVLFVHEGRLYTLDFTPADPTADAFARMKTLYGSMLDSFTLLPRDGQVIAGQTAANDCLAPTSKTRLLADDHARVLLALPGRIQRRRAESR